MVRWQRLPVVVQQKSCGNKAKGVDKLLLNNVCWGLSGYNVTVRLVNVLPPVPASQIQPVGVAYQQPKLPPDVPALFGSNESKVVAVSSSRKIVIVVRLQISGANVTPFDPDKQKTLLEGLGQVGSGFVGHMYGLGEG